MKKTLTLSLMAALGLSLNSYAQGQEVTGDNQFDISLQLRPRAEYRDGNFRPVAKGENPAALVSNRLRMETNYSHSDILKTKVSLQNVSIWGQNDQVQGINPGTNALGIFEAYADLKIYKGLGAKVGRQAISLDDERLFGDLDWQQGGRSHDALSLYFSKNDFDVKTYFAFNQNYAANYGSNLNNPSGNYYSTINAQPYKYMQTLHIGYQICNTSHISALFTNIGLQNTDLSNPTPNKNLSNLRTTGANYNLRSEYIDLDVSAYYQFGKNAAFNTVSAYYGAVDVSGKITNDFAVGLRSEYHSGNSTAQAGTVDHAFNALYGTGHKFNGHMDYYPYSNSGLWDNALKVKYIASEHIDLNFAGHFFYTPNEFINGTQKYKGDLGQEIDLNMNYKVNPFIAMTVGYSMYFANDNTLALKNVVNPKPVQHWGWLSLNVNPKIFKGRF